MFILFLDDDDDSIEVDDVHLYNVESNVVVGDDDDEDQGNMDFI